ncbi:MAG: PIN domain-containing protein [Candidatus Micrarchaeaceae archaeon]
MTIIDTSLVMEKVNEGEAIDEDVSAITMIEYPVLLEYKHFHGEILYPNTEDLRLALGLQESLRKTGMMKSAADLIIAATCINRGIPLLTSDSDFYDISRISKLKLA